MTSFFNSGFCIFGQTLNLNFSFIFLNLLRSVCADLGPGEMLITWPILNGFPDFKDQQTHDAPDVLLVLFLKKLTIPRQS